jgi:hypothetical protein
MPVAWDLAGCRRFWREQFEVCLNGSSVFAARSVGKEEIRRCHPAVFSAREMTA